MRVGPAVPLSTVADELDKSRTGREVSVSLMSLSAVVVWVEQIV